MTEPTNMASSPKQNNENDNNNINNNVKDYEILDEDHSEYDLAFKIIIIGNSGVGKSCLSLRATKNFFNNDYSTTIGFEYFKYNVKLKSKEESTIRLHIWDTCGQEIYRSLVANYYKNTSLAILVYSVDE